MAPKSKHASRLNVSTAANERGEGTDASGECYCNASAAGSATGVVSHATASQSSRDCISEFQVLRDWSMRDNGKDDRRPGGGDVGGARMASARVKQPRPVGRDVRGHRVARARRIFGSIVGVRGPARGLLSNWALRCRGASDERSEDVFMNTWSKFCREQFLLV